MKCGLQGIMPCQAHVVQLLSVGCTHFHILDLVKQLVSYVAICVNVSGWLIYIVTYLD